ncbi:TetR/AcrR family transcriptional regulator [Caulobacter mirabilis]|uniref:TetR family transcriptional regulator n=1 Tax=Caulobacter mirabilis TaxID=69666 RepID=A0A2D2AUE6_9CAUL|nr:TetR/AcrR family transcriptional regulator [Caulobacter mirabilis]ATQ41630.1 TetR family transcriptional regulator [Caulobacter mirabilis]
MPRLLSETDVADFRERLITAAEHLFAEHGPDGVTMRQLAAALGVSPMTPYRYFKDKDAILAAVRASGFARFAGALEAATAASVDGVGLTTATGRAYVKFALENPDAYRLMFDFAQPNEADYPDLVEATARSRAMLIRHAEGLVKAGEAEGDPVMIAHIIWSSLHGQLVLQMAGKLSPDVDPSALRREAFATILRGLKPRA